MLIFILDSSTESSIMWTEDLKVGVGNFGYMFVVAIVKVGPYLIQIVR